jgi:hypothetical protein
LERETVDEDGEITKRGGKAIGESPTEGRTEAKVEEFDVL